MRSGTRWDGHLPLRLHSRELLAASVDYGPIATCSLHPARLIALTAQLRLFMLQAHAVRRILIHNAAVCMK
jgi:hypothetical protein